MRDQTFLQIVVFGLLVWFTIGAVGLFRTARKWWKGHKTREEILRGVVPVDYQLVIEEAGRVNRILSDGPLDEQQSDGFIIQDSALQNMRQKVGRIRDDGFVVGYTKRGQLSNNPYPTGSGESKQWVRGYCMGRNITDPKPYMDKA